MKNKVKYFSEQKDKRIQLEIFVKIKFHAGIFPRRTFSTKNYIFKAFFFFSEVSTSHLCACLYS